MTCPLKAEGCLELSKAMGTCQSVLIEFSSLLISFLPSHVGRFCKLGSITKRLQIDWNQSFRVAKSKVKHSDFVVCAAPHGPKSYGVVFISRTLLGNRQQQHYKRMLEASSVVLLATCAACAACAAFANWVPTRQVTEKRHLASPAQHFSHIEGSATRPLGLTGLALIGEPGKRQQQLSSLVSPRHLFWMAAKNENVRSKISHII